MTVIVWIVEGTWMACVDAAATLAPADSDIALLHVTVEEIPAAAHGAYTGLLGRGHPDRDPGRHVEELAASAAKQLLTAAAHRLHRPSTRLHRRGRPEQEVLDAAKAAELLILARDGDRSRPGPKSLGRASRFVVDHAPCPVLLVWPQSAPDTSSIPPAPPHQR
ncbi:universal stress protein [Amycolatopsis thermophila]|uniref:Nucleotide-binding universal stress UspA family protein n=1 Tax=Amycolatopsis thermophila TaxID=206084 RepID=A0ABU0ES91_9PSEU|nr:universal stress protein [Amycolatopsis thermophila]MDQ0377871.1 nucleotide-binding universal stress UspA family protein [Amycolatopsis thermophila]